MSKFCANCKKVVVAECEDSEDSELCPIEVKDICISNTLVDTEFGINNEMNSKEVIEKLIEKIKELEFKIK